MSNAGAPPPWGSSNPPVPFPPRKPGAYPHPPASSGYPQSAYQPRAGGYPQPPPNPYSSFQPQQGSAAGFAPQGSATGFAPQGSAAVPQGSAGFAPQGSAAGFVPQGPTTPGFAPQGSGAPGFVPGFTPQGATAGFAPQGFAPPPPPPGYVPPPPVVSRPPSSILSPPQFQPAPPPLAPGNYARVPPPPPPFQQQHQQQQQQQYFQHPAANLVEDFASLSLAASKPGSFDASIAEALPRPEEVEEEEEKQEEARGGNCHPRYFRLTTNAIPASHSLAARWQLPLGAVIHPLAEAPAGEEVPVIDFGKAGIVRCRRCRTYINPFVSFADQGRVWRCSICMLNNDVPKEYMDRMNGPETPPELSSGTADLVASAEYMLRPPMPPVYFFLIDVSASALRTGVLQVIVSAIKSCLDKLPGFPRTHVGFMTFDNTLHFYNLKSSLRQPQMVVVGQIEDPFVPLPDDLIVNLSESRTVVDSLLDSLPSAFAGNEGSIESAFGPALQAAVSLMDKLGGKLLIFQSSLPSIGAGRLKTRDEDPRVYGTDREHLLRVAVDPFYKQMAAECSKYQIGVDVFAFSDKYTDVASLGVLSKYTGGQVYYYPSFHASVDGERLHYDLSRNLTRETAWEAVMRIRCGKGVKYSAYQGHFMLRSSDLLALPAVDCDKAFTVQFALDETLLTSSYLNFQVALLYTSSSGERRIRVHTASVPVVTELGQLYRAANVGAVISTMSRLAIEKSLSDKLEEARHFLQKKMMNGLREFRKLQSVHQLMGRMVFPQSLRLFPLYVLALCKALALRGGYLDATADARSAAGYEMMVMSAPRLLRLLYPLFIRLDEYLAQEPNQLKPLPLSAQELDSRGAYLYFDGLRIVIWLGKMLSPDFISNIWEPQDGQQSQMLNRYNLLLKKLRSQYPEVYQPCLVVREGDAVRELQLLHSNLLEDRVAGFPAYEEWIVQTHRQVQ